MCFVNGLRLAQCEFETFETRKRQTSVLVQRGRFSPRME